MHFDIKSKEEEKSWLLSSGPQKSIQSSIFLQWNERNDVVKRRRCFLVKTKNNFMTEKVEKAILWTIEIECTYAATKK